MTLRYMLDTNICIRVMRSDLTSPLLGRFNRLASQICISAITLAELRFGAEKSSRVAQNLDAIDFFKAHLPVLTFDEKAADEFGRVRVEVLRQTISAMDMLIAAHARSRDLTIVTNNGREFSRVPGLRVEDWS